MKKFISTTATTLSLILVSLAYGSTPALADDETVNLGPPPGFGNIPNTVNLTKIIGGVLQLLLLAAAVFFFVYLVIGGIKWIMSGGDKAQIEAARNQITHALIGLVIVFAAWLIAGLVNSLVGINIFAPPIPNFQGAFE